VLSVSYHPQGRRLASVGQDRVIRVWDVVVRQEILELDDAVGGLRQVAFSPNGRYLAAAGLGGVRLWDADRDFTPAAAASK
jgi:WD40 repeat protein